jgi:hypothetical protein
VRSAWDYPTCTGAPAGPSPVVLLVAAGAVPVVVDEAREAINDLLAALLVARW